MKPKYLYRKDDGQKFALQANGKYVIVLKGAATGQPYGHEYSYEVLKSHGFVDSPDKCEYPNPRAYHTAMASKYKPDGHGDYDDD